MDHYQQVERFNKECFCLPLKRSLFIEQLVGELPELERPLAERDHLFAGTGILATQQDIDTMLQVVQSVEALVGMPAYQSRVFDRSEIAMHWKKASTKGLFMGYDFHLSAAGPQLIEINTNAGGAFLGTEVQQIAEREYPGCCDFQPVLFQNSNTGRTSMAQAILDEWSFAGKLVPLNTVAIVDDNPRDQYLLPDTLLAQRALSDLGINALLLGIEELDFDGGNLVSNGIIIDMVYNRSTDFLIESKPYTPVVEAAKNHSTVVSPSPKHYSLYADKRNLIDMSDDTFLSSIGLDLSHREVLQQHVPRTTSVTPSSAEWHHKNRRKLFFKPTKGYGSKAVYRGDKMTKRVWQHVLNNDYVAQALVPPTVRALKTNGVENSLKFDVRIFTAAGKPLLALARVYDGQATNFRSIGGGFAPIYGWTL